MVSVSLREEVGGAERWGQPSPSSITGGAVSRVGIQSNWVGIY